jgi:glutathione peroxidase
MLASPAGMPPMTTLHDFATVDIDGHQRALSEFAGQVLLVVNVASRCGFTPQYTGLERLWQERRDRGFVVLGFPCDQFGHQEPGDEAAIRGFCALNYGVTFPMFAKVEVNGPGAHPLWRWLQREKRGLFGTGAIKWNFTKFLVGRDGRVLARYAPREQPEALLGAIDRALAQPAG